ncbi:MAG: hypothetical protein HZB25_09630 [Candidatus Eisenbacteria bacterium]|nr:hypothetical protein [Candidatus Eisenbacteria bacterium]
MRHTGNTIATATAGLLLIGCLEGCDKDSQGTISMASKYSAAAIASSRRVPPQAGRNAAAIDSIVVTRARFVLRDIKFKGQSDSASFRTLPFVLELNLAGNVQDISSIDVPFATYRRVEFDVHKIESGEVAALPPAERAQFDDFLQGDKYSIILTCRVYSQGAMEEVLVRSRVNAKQKIDLSPELVVSEADPVATVTLRVSAGGWFDDKHGGLLDPADPHSESEIADNLKDSIHVFKDRNRDGSPD